MTSSKTDILQNIKIRKFQMEDYEVVLALWQACGLPAKPTGRDSREKIQKEISRDFTHFLVAELDNKLIGTVVATTDGRKGWVNRLAVTEELRHNGIARLLLEKAEQIFNDMGIEIFTCLIEADNETSMNFFQKSGYVKHTDIIYFSKRKYPGV